MHSVTHAHSKIELLWSLNIQNLFLILLTLSYSPQIQRWKGVKESIYSLLVPVEKSCQPEQSLSNPCSWWAKWRPSPFIPGATCRMDSAQRPSWPEMLLTSVRRRQSCQWLSAPTHLGHVCEQHSAPWAPLTVPKNLIEF